MAILGTFIDRQTVSRVSDGLSQTVALATLNHSLPATNPEMVLPILRSVEAANVIQAVPAVIGLGGNASILTIGYAIGSAASCPTISFDVVAQVFYSTIR